jgi:hypothetical protein
MFIFICARFGWSVEEYESERNRSCKEGSFICDRNEIAVLGLKPSQTSTPHTGCHPIVVQRLCHAWGKQ